MGSSAREIEKVYPTEIGMLADPRAGLKELAEALSAEISGSAREAAATRRASIAAQKAQAKAAHQERVKQRWDSRPISAERMMGELAQVIPSGAIVADESVTSRGALMGAIDFDERAATMEARAALWDGPCRGAWVSSWPSPAGR